MPRDAIRYQIFSSDVQDTRLGSADEARRSEQGMLTGQEPAETMHSRNEMIGIEGQLMRRLGEDEEAGLSQTSETQRACARILQKSHGTKRGRPIFFPARTMM